SSNPPRLWALETGNIVRALDPKAGWGGQLAAFSPDSRLALVAQIKSPKNTRQSHLAVWDVNSGKVLRVLEEPAWEPARFTNGNQEVVGTSFSEPKGPGRPWRVRFRFWEAATGRLI